MKHKIKRIDWTDGLVTFDILSDADEPLLENQTHAFNAATFPPSALLTPATLAQVTAVLPAKVAAQQTSMVERWQAHRTSIADIELRAVKLGIVQPDNPALLTNPQL